MIPWENKHELCKNMSFLVFKCNTQTDVTGSEVTGCWSLVQAQHYWLTNAAQYREKSYEALEEL